MSAVSIVVSALVLTAVSITLYKAPLLLHASVLSSMVRKQWRLMSVGSALFVRACRSPHYIGANFFLAGLLVCASCLAWFKPALPFDAVCVLVLLLVGTLGQEARSIGKKHVPVELVLYGAKRQWVGAIWQLTLINAAFFTALMLVIAILWFPHDVGAGYMQIVCTAIFLAIGGLLAASPIVPHHDDIVMQLLSMALYGAFGWAILHILADKSSVTQAVITGLGVMCGFLLCYWCESLRWVIAIRGKYAFSRR
jgi:hypothetical protein